jgi:tRNA(Ile)-lysidine synthase
MIHKFEEFIFLKQLLDKEDKVIVAVSGGIDSMVLLTMLHHLQYKVVAAHCNYGLRKEEANSEENLVKDYCKQLGITCYVNKIEDQDIIAKSGLGVQEFARNYRYEWFEKLRTQLEFTKIATAHHLDDQLETLLFHLTRGTGLSGIRGIALKKGHLVRPMLCYEKNEIIQIGAELKIPFNTDSSNLTEKYTRNVIRQKLVPVLKSINSKVSIHAQELSEWASFYLSNSGLKTAIECPYLIPYDTILNQTHPIQYLLHLLKPFGFNKYQINDAMSMIYNQNFGKTIVAKTHSIFCNKNGLELVQREKQFNSHLKIDQLPFEGYFNEKFIRIETTEEPYAFQSQNSLFLGLTELQLPMVLETIQSGDLFSPFGMKGHKTIGNYFTDKKTPHSERNRAIKLRIGEAIAAVIPGTIDNAFAVNAESKLVLKITF